MFDSESVIASEFLQENDTREVGLNRGRKNGFFSLRFVGFQDFKMKWHSTASYSVTDLLALCLKSDVVERFLTQMQDGVWNLLPRNCPCRFT